MDRGMSQKRLNDAESEKSENYLELQETQDSAAARRAQEQEEINEKLRKDASRKRAKSKRVMKDINTSHDRDAAIGSFLFATSKGDIRTVLDMLQSGEVSVNDGDYDRRAALHIATADGFLNIVQSLVAAGADVNISDRWGNTPLDEATRHGQTEVATYLKSHGGRHGTGADFGMELLRAVARGDLAEVQKLVASGVDVNSSDYDKRTALHVAIGTRNTELVQYLIEQGADLEATDSFGHTPAQEAHRVGVRTGDDPIIDVLKAAQMKDAASPLHITRNPLRNGYLWFAILTQIVIGILFAIFVEYDQLADAHQARSLGSPYVTEFYGFYMDVHVMIFIGFGFLMTFLRKFGYFAVGVNWLIAVLAIEWYLLIGPFWERVFHADFSEKISINIVQLIRADFSAGAVLISFGALLGKTSPLQMIAFTIIEIFFYSLNEEISLRLGIADIGGSMVIHTFGAYFGLTASLFMTPKNARGNKDNSAVYRSDLFAMIGTIFLFIYWPSFNGALGVGNQKHRAIINTVLSLSASVFTTFFATQLWRNDRKFNMVDIQNATISGGVAMGTCADMVIHPAVAILIGTFTGLVSTFGFARLQGFIERKIGLHDTCGVHNLHGMPGIIGGISGAIASSVADQGLYGCRIGNDDPAGQLALGCINIADPNATVYPDSGQLTDIFVLRAQRTASQQAGIQIAYLFITLAIAIVSGALTGLLLKGLNPPKKFFVDDQSWEVPERETPYYFDERGEIIRDHQNRPTFDDARTPNMGNQLEKKIADLEARISALQRPSQQQSNSSNDVGAAATIMLLQNLNSKIDAIASERKTA
eukprot:TRINITY_DN953_c0_g1_i1.p1 TRINITY_DN953_c0_g1~~TRINITY_DN953_c0_g1_i1.p1  ORF type:complete len:819 (-),score=301.90 TRINITY_DN953_c0_g1_i1:59-2515(-)